MRDKFEALAKKYNDNHYFECDPVIFPKHFLQLYKEGQASLQDIEISALFASHLAWGRRDMIVRDCKRLFEEMEWQPYNYVMGGEFRDDDSSLHRTIKWCEIAKICTGLKDFYSSNDTLETLSVDDIREKIFGRKRDLNAANKKIHLFRRWMVRDDNIVDLGVWKRIKPSELIIPLDVHVHRNALDCGITKRKSADFKAAKEITEYFAKIFPSDPCKGDFCLFGAGIDK